MKRVFFVILIAVLSITAACNDKSDNDKPCNNATPEPSKITMITDVSGEYGGIRMAGTGTITINWGDGTEVETQMLKEPVDNWDTFLNTEYSYNHKYSGTSILTIIITGENITHFYCRNSQLKSLDVSKNAALTNLICGNGAQLTNLDVSKNAALTNLDCSGNKLTNLDVSKNTMLINLNCEENLLESLNVSKNTKLTNLQCGSNQLDVEALNTLFGTLHNNSGTKQIDIGYNPGTHGCDQNIATNKGWTVSDYSSLMTMSNNY